MSQEKVNRYKEDKKNRKAIVAKKKRNALLTKVCGSVIVIALAAWLGFSAVDSYQKSQTSGEVVVDTTALDNYMNNTVAAE